MLFSINSYFMNKKVNNKLESYRLDEKHLIALEDLNSGSSYDNSSLPEAFGLYLKQNQKTIHNILMSIITSKLLINALYRFNIIITFNHILTIDIVINSELYDSANDYLIVIV